MLALTRQAVHLTGSRNLCLAGGVAMNSKANGALLASGLVDRLFVQPAATDDGTEMIEPRRVHEPEIRLRLGCGDLALGFPFVEEFALRSVVAAEDEAVLPLAEIADHFQVG